MAKTIFITGTDTDIGKTFVSAALVKKWSCNYWKPIQTGLSCDSGDTSTVQELLRGGKDLPCRVNPAVEYQFPLSPYRCSVLEGKKEVDIDSIRIPTKLANASKPLIIEGAGGVFVPLTKELITTDLIKHLNVPVIVVARSGLGTLNHTLLTIEHLKMHDIQILGVILNGDLNCDNKKCLEDFGVKIIAQIPRAATVDDVQQFVPDLDDVYKY